MNRSERLLTVGEVALFLRLNQSSVYRLVRSGKLTCVRIGRAIRVRPVDLATFVQEGMV